MKIRELTVLGIGLGIAIAGNARAWESVRWPATVCSAIDTSADHNLVYTENGVLDNYNRTETFWGQCPVRIPPGLAADEFVEWSADVMAPRNELCLLRIASEQGELLATSITRPPEPDEWRPGFVKFNWQPANAALYGVSDTTAVVRCAQPAQPNWPSRNWPATSIVSVAGPGDGDTERHHWPGMMCRPSLRQDLEFAEVPTEDMDVLYNSGGAVANMNTRAERLVVCPVPLPAETTGHKISVYWQGRFLTGATRYCQLIISGYHAAQGGRTDVLWSVGSFQDQVKVMTIDVTLPQFVADDPWKINANVTCSLAPNDGELGPAGITSYTTEIAVAPADPASL